MFFLYLILWIVIPKARTPRQMLEMQGDPVTKENLERFLKEEMIDIDTNLSRITRSEKSASLLSSIICAIGRILKFFLYFIGTLMILGICIFIAIGLGYVIYGATACSTFFSTMFYGNIYLNAAAGIIICLIPIILLLLIPIRPIFKIYPKKPFYIILSSLWLVAIIYGSIIAIRSLPRYQRFGYHEDKISMPIKGGTLYIKSLDPNSYYHYSHDRYNIDEAMIAGRSITIDDCDRHETTDSIVKVSIIKRVYSKSLSTAYDKARKMEIDYRIEGDTLFVDRQFKINSPEDLLDESDLRIHKPAHLKHIDETK